MIAECAEATAGRSKPRPQPTLASGYMRRAPSPRNQTTCKGPGVPAPPSPNPFLGRAGQSVASGYCRHWWCWWRRCYFQRFGGYLQDMNYMNPGLASRTSFGGHQSLLAEGRNSKSQFSVADAHLGCKPELISQHCIVAKLEYLQHTTPTQLLDGETDLLN